MGKSVRLDKLLANSGFGSRKDIKSIVKEGLVVINGKTVKDASAHVDPEIDSITIDGEAFQYREFIYLMLNKPAGVISATWDNQHSTVVDIIPDEYKVFDLFPVGRLDIDTEGLLLLTNDGKTAHNLLAPRKHVPKKYYARLDGDVGEDDIAAFRQGIVLDDGYKTLPSELVIVQPGEIIVTIYEGKFHQVKRMFEAVGKRVRYLKRISMGMLTLDEELKPGQCRELSPEEVELLKTILPSVG